jgi:hypothetical protein
MEEEQPMANEKVVVTTDTKNEGMSPEPAQVPAKKPVPKAPPKPTGGMTITAGTAKPALTGLNG